MSTTMTRLFGPMVAMLRRPAQRRRNAHALASIPDGGVNRREWVRLGGVEQFVTIRGHHRGNPLLLVIHGGPASPYVPFNPILSQWEQIVTVVQWDQRGAGQTFVRNGGDPYLSVDRLANDGLELADWLAGQFERPIILMGSSVGTVIAMRMARSAPRRFEHYVGANQVGLGSRAASWRQVRAAFEEQGKSRQIAALDALGPDPAEWTAKQAEQVSKLAIAATPDVPDMVHDLMLPALMYTPDYTMSDIRAIGTSMAAARETLYAELLDPDLSGPFDLPVLLVHGRSDLVNPLSAVEALLPALDAPSVDLVPVPGAGHLVEFAAPHQFAAILRDKVPACSSS
ncbi:alpha/beta hydrolase [Hoyosella sp. YIM 151337]|uniref:alpha/beta fold hydrolase n=1 Tax=Hoyosella sp. YIM 151337 TaxID=2992742 RepID=UPI0022359A72|nr:alpha/beta hydrolase [Hoyosella sp. YIM 151337]MCW4355048.1 alpha/beta hydrolase [Hoyosella sp. YIM 151337]